jgi:hypothetical protein
MSAAYAELPDKVAVTIRGSLSHETWRVLRDARIIALEKHLPFCLDIRHCCGGDMGGLGALMIAQHQLGKITIEGCDRDFALWFGNIGVCDRCDRSDSRNSCREAVAEELVA